MSGNHEIDNADKRTFVDAEVIKKEFDEYRKFAYKQNFFAMALAIVLVSQTQKFASAITESILMPIIMYFISITSGDWRNLIVTPVKGLNLEIGHFVNAFLEFTIITFILYIIFHKVIKKLDPDAVLEAPHFAHLRAKSNQVEKRN